MPLEPVLMDHQTGIVELIGRGHERFLDCRNMSLAEAERLGDLLCTMQRDIMFWLGDLSRYAEHRWPDTYQQAFPAWVSPGLLARAAGVCRAYPKQDDRHSTCTYSQYMQAAGKPDRLKRLVKAEGMTTDESRSQMSRPTEDNAAAAPQRRWLLAVDCNYFLHRFWHSGAGVEAASGVASWIKRTVERLKQKGLTDVACCFDSHVNHRKELTTTWDDKYKDRPPKDPELGHQLAMVRDLLDKAGFACASVDGMEADDVMASYAQQFGGVVTLLTQDKDQRQCLSSTCNILLDVEWSQDEHSGEMLPAYKWLSAKDHAEQTGIPPERWIDYQCLMGDACDGIKGAEGIGQKGAADLIQQFGSVDAVIEAARNGDESIREKKRESLIRFADKLDITRQLVTLRTDLDVPMNTRI